MQKALSRDRRKKELVKKSFPRHTVLSFSFEKCSTRGFMIDCQEMFHYARLVLLVRRELFHQARIYSVSRSTNHYASHQDPWSAIA